MRLMRKICLSCCLLLAGCGEPTLEEAAQAGDAQSQFEYSNKIQQTKPGEARDFLVLAASKGVVEAQYKLGLLITDGEMGFVQDRPKGFFWLEKAAMAGHASAKNRVAYAYAKGIGTRADAAKALRWTDIDSDRLDPEVAEVVGQALLSGTGVTKDETRGRKLLEYAAKHGSAESIVSLIRYDQSLDPKGNNFAELLPRWKRAAELGHAEACATWGYYLYNGIGLPADKPTAVRFLEKAAAKEDEYAIQCLYWAHNDPKYKDRDPRKAFALLQRVGDRANGETCYLLARCYYFGQGTEKDDRKQLDYLRRGQAKQNVSCMASLAWAYQFGLLGLKKDEDRAVSTYLRAARLGRDRCFDSAARILVNDKDDAYFRSILKEAEKADAPDCLFWLGYYYHFGRADIPKDPAKAAALYERSVSAGNNLAKTYLGLLLMDGLGTAKNTQRGISLIKEAALAGVSDAQFTYACYLDEGTGTPQDSSMAYFWANIAAAGSNNEAFGKERDKLAKKIGQAEMLRIQALCREWLKKQEDSHATQDNPDLETPAGGSGSGLIFTTDGLVLTNHHVVAGCSRFKVITAQGEELVASLVASDEKLDVAVLRLAGRYRHKAFPRPPRLASSSPVKSGEKVFTVGHPLGGLLSSEAKYNDGTVSAMSGMGDDQRVMQISVPIQPGNSGGPLANSRGEVVGLIVSTVNGSALLRETNILAQNINFAIKSDQVISFLRDQGLPTDHGAASNDPVEHVKAYAVKIISTP